MELKKCTKCGLSKPLSEFQKHSQNKCGLRPRCKECESKKKVFKPKKCAVCDSEFIPRSSLQKYCSHQCSYKAELSRRNKKTGNKKCLHCEKEFSPYTSLDKFCSTECRINHQKSKRGSNWNESQCKKITGKNNPAYRNGTYQRSVNRTSIGEREFIKNRTEIKKSISGGSGYLSCEHCGASNSLRFEAHHLIFRSEKPLHENLHDKENIIILCIQCHNVFHKNKSVRNDIVRKRKLNELFGNDVLDK